MDINKMTQKLQEGVMEAQSEAIKRNQQEVDIAHLLYTHIRSFTYRSSIFSAAGKSIACEKTSRYRKWC
jgi:ATP-dependent Clp protease ATP-binding subunit ClpA